MSSKAAGPTTEISDASGQHRLTMRYVRSGDGRHYFDALIWWTQEAGGWKQRLMISRADFGSGSDRRRWVSEVHSFDPATGHAIIKVAEGDAPETADTINYVYSWREWSLLDNREVRLIRICADPFEKY